ncbi:hypothetical protein ACLOJK_025828 [Asimina triloba]
MDGADLPGTEDDWKKGELIEVLVVFGWFYFFFISSSCFVCVGSASFSAIGMASGEEEKNRDFYSVLGLKKECSALELRSAYKKLALRWHPDRCSASGNSKFIEEAKLKFQAIQVAYSVLSDANKRFLYDLGIYDSDDEENGMSDFVAVERSFSLVNVSNPEGPSVTAAFGLCQGNTNESFEGLQEVFDEIFQQDGNCFSSFTENADSIYSASCTVGNCNNLQRSSSEISCLDNSNVDVISLDFCFGVYDGEDMQQQSKEPQSGRRQKISSLHDATSPDVDMST